MKTSTSIQEQQSQLTDKELRFANYYLGEANLNATEAAKLAGYSRNTARQIGYENLTKPYIKKYIQLRSSEILERMGVTQEMVLKEIAKIAFSDITEFFNDDWSLKNLSEINKGKTASIKSFKKTENGVSVQLHDKMKALFALEELMKTR